MDLKKYIRDAHNFPRKGITFKDIAPLLANPKAFKYAVDKISDFVKKKKAKALVGVESRGFIFGAAVAYKLGLKFVPVRKKGKLPLKTKRAKYKLEYGTAEIEIQEDALEKNEKTIVIDDLLATGGTACATCYLVEQLNADIVGITFLVDLTYLKGTEKLIPYEVFSLIKY